MSHETGQRASCVSTRRDGRARWLWRLVRRRSIEDRLSVKSAELDARSHVRRPKWSLDRAYVREAAKATTNANADGA